MLAPARRARPVDAVASQLREAILAGSPPPGETLTPERELAASLGVSRLTLRAALARLEAEGLIRARQGDGVRVLDPKQHATLEMLAHLDLESHPDLVRSFLELRRAVACEAVALACTRADGAARERLRALVDAQRTEADAARYVERDLAISRAVLSSADNFAMLLLLNSVETVYRAHPELADALTRDRDRSIAGYDVVLVLLEAGDPARAREVLRAALEHADAEVIEQLAHRSGAKSRSTQRPENRRKARP